MIRATSIENLAGRIPDLATAFPVCCWRVWQEFLEQHKSCNYNIQYIYILHRHTYIHYITLHYTTLHYIILHYITLHYITYIYIYYRYSNCRVLWFKGSPTHGKGEEQFMKEKTEQWKKVPGVLRYSRHLKTSNQFRNNSDGI